MYQIFSDVWHDCGYTWDDFMVWMAEKHVKFMQVIHVEVGIEMFVLVLMLIMMMVLMLIMMIRILFMIFSQLAHSENHIKRYVFNLTVLLADWDLQQKLQVDILVLLLLFGPLSYLLN